MQWRVQVVGDEYRDLYPYAVVNLETQETLNKYSHRSVADGVAFALNTNDVPERDVTEIEEHVLSEFVKLGRTSWVTM